MRYIVTKRFRTEYAICGTVNLPYGTVCEMEDDTIRLPDGRRLCLASSQNGYDFFSRDDDGCGKRRGALVQEIKSRLARRDSKHQARWDKLWDDDGANKLRNPAHSDFWVWAFDFYNAAIPELERVLALVKGV